MKINIKYKKIINKYLMSFKNSFTNEKAKKYFINNCFIILVMKFNMRIRL